MCQDVDASIRRRGRRDGRRALSRTALAAAGLLWLQACSPFSEYGGPAGAKAGAPPRDVPVRDEPSAGEIHAEQTQGRDAPDAVSARDESLLDTYWKLIELGDQAVVAKGQQREPHLILHREGNRVSAHGGCNRLSGSYRLRQERLTFGKLIATRMACEPGYRQEARFTAALAACAAWQVKGPYLELFDETGKRIARFEVRHL